MSRETIVVPNGGWDERVVVCRTQLMDGSTVDAFIVVTERYVVLLDTFDTPHAAIRLLEVAARYLSRGRRSLVVNTHADWDHAWGNQVFGGTAPLHAAPIIGSQECARRLKSKEMADRLQTFQTEHGDWFAGVKLVAPDITFAETLVVDGGDLTLELFATPGHTADHVAAFIPAIRMLFAGDGAEDPFPFADGGDGIAPLRRSLASMAARDPATVLYCHAPVNSGPALLRSNIAYFDRVAEHCRRALEHGFVLDGLNDVELLAQIGLPFQSVVPTGTDPAAFHPMYPVGHAGNARAMLAWLASRPDVSDAP